MFEQLLAIVRSMSEATFQENSLALADWIDSLSREEFLEVMTQIGVIPESIAHDSTEEKLFSKATDAALCRAFREMGMKAVVLSERADSADVFAESRFHGYTLVADAKAFRLSRTARNQKDYKVTALSSWRKGNDYAVLCAPFFQYPNRQSQIYKQALDDDVCLFSWEQVLMILSADIQESPSRNFSRVWDWPDMQAGRTTAKNSKRCFLGDFMRDFGDIAGIGPDDLSAAMRRQIELIRERGRRELDYWHRVVDEISAYSRERAIDELLSAKKIPGKIETIQAYMDGLSYGAE